jgi:hypothetical protein
VKNDRADALPPDGLPVLSRGRHARAEEGACLMEYVSVIAGEPFSDHPGCVEPLLVRLAWAVNDTAPPPVRARLVHFAPRLIGTRNDSPKTAPTLLTACIEAVASVVDLEQDAYLVAARARAGRRLAKLEQRASGRRVRWADKRYRRWHADDVLRECVRLTATEAPNSLPKLLEAALESVEDVKNATPAKAAAAAW